LRVPEDVAVVGYDDIELAQYVQPALTTICQPIARGAAALVAALFAIIEGRSPESEMLPTGLIVRESSAKRSSKTPARITQ
jgi:DNA-binding LacI/PurR family transcriptional regulator